VKTIKKVDGYEWWQVSLFFELLVITSVFGPALGLLFVSHANVLGKNQQTKIEYVYANTESHIASKPKIIKPEEARESISNSWDMTFKKKEIIDKYNEDKHLSFQEVNDLMKLSLDDLKKKLEE
jgi:hypothetical protein